MPFFGGSGSGDYHIVGTNIEGGDNAMSGTVGYGSMALGNYSLQYTLNPADTVAIGNYSLQNAANPDNSVAVGFQAGMGSDGIGCVFVGAIAGAGAGDYNVLIGKEAGRYSADQNVIIGFGAASDSGFPLPPITADSVIVGYNAGNSGTQNNAVLIGFDSGVTTSIASKNNCVAIGSGSLNQTAVTPGNAIVSDGSVSIGTDAAKRAANNLDYTDTVSIGRNCATSGAADASNSIYIGANITVGGPDEIKIGGLAHESVNIGKYDIQEIARTSVNVQFGTPSGIAPTGAMGNNGALTLGTALPAVYSGIYLYFPANAIFAGSAAGSYWCEMTSTTAGTVYNNLLAGIPAWVNFPTQFVSTGPGAYTGEAGSVTLATYTLPADSLGPTGRLINSALFELEGINAKTISCKISATNIYSSTPTTNKSVYIYKELWARGSDNEQVRPPSANVGPLSSVNFGVQSSMNMGVDQDMTWVGQAATSGEYVILAAASVSCVYGA